jgi:hypothetical protein
MDDYLPSDTDLEQAGDMTTPVNLAAPSKDQKTC